MRFPPAVLSVRVRRTSALGILACATAQVMMCHPPARHWMSGDLFDIRGAVYVEHDGPAKTLDELLYTSYPLPILQQLSYPSRWKRAPLSLIVAERVA